VWLEVLLNKKGPTVAKAFANILSKISIKPKRLLTDSGGEFSNKYFQNVLKTHNIQHRLARTTFKAGSVERVQRSLQKIMYTYMRANDTDIYIDVLPQLLATYNKRYHTAIKMSPTEAELDNRQNEVRRNVWELHSKQRERGKKQRAKFKVGERVRIEWDRGTFGRGYHDNFSEEIFQIYSIVRHMPIILYELQDKNGEILQGKWYSNQLQRIRGTAHKETATFEN